MNGKSADQRNVRKVFIKSYGCQMNAYDATRMADLLAPSGYGEVDRAEDADLVILNTCHIREKATDKVYSELGRLGAMKTERAAAGHETTIAVAGCVAQAEGSELLRRAPGVDVVVGPQSYHRLPALLAEAASGRRVIDTEFPADDKFGHLPQAARDNTRLRGFSSFVTVQEGCDKFCSFCVVPFTRGAEMSRPAARILTDIHVLADAGVREVTLIGQNVNAYHGDGPTGGVWDLAQLLEAAARIPGIARLRYTTSHPTDMNERLIAAHGDLPQLMPYLHLPVQSGSDRILTAMNRKHGRDDYLRIIERVRRVRPDIALSSDFIVGYPGESAADFAETMGLIADVGYAAAFSFKYSRRPGTVAAALQDDEGEAVVNQRLHDLQALVLRQQDAFNHATVGRTLDVLVEKKGRHPGQLTGKSPYLQPVFFNAPDALIGEIISVEIENVRSNSLSAHRVEVAIAEQSVNSRIGALA